MTKDEVVNIARGDLASRLGVDEAGITTVSAEDAVFPDSALGAYLEDEMAADMLTNGWRIGLKGPDGTAAEYRANPRQVRLFQFGGENYLL